MRKAVINNSNSTLQKARDTSRIYELSLANDNERITLDDDANVTVKIGNKVGYLSDVECEVKNGVILLDSVDLEEFPADKYRLEVWIEKNGRKPVFARVMFELGIWSETDVLSLGAKRKEV